MLARSTMGRPSKGRKTCVSQRLNRVSAMARLPVEARGQPAGEGEPAVGGVRLGVLFAEQGQDGAVAVAKLQPVADPDAGGGLAGGGAHEDEEPRIIVAAGDRQRSAAGIRDAPAAGGLAVVVRGGAAIAAGQRGAAFRCRDVPVHRRLGAVAQQLLGDEAAALDAHRVEAALPSFTWTRKGYAVRGSEAVTASRSAVGPAPGPGVCEPNSAGGCAGRLEATSTCCRCPWSPAISGTRRSR